MDLPPLDCAGCRKCCLGDTVLLTIPEVRGGTYFMRDLPFGQKALAVGKDGNCVYLGPDGCRIHERAPQACKAFDCRAYFLRFENDEQGFDARLRGQTQEPLMEGRARVRRLRAVSI